VSADQAKEKKKMKKFSWISVLVSLINSKVHNLWFFIHLKWLEYYILLEAKSIQQNSFVFLVFKIKLQQ
jgi:hypothetical protein